MKGRCYDKGKASVLRNDGQLQVVESERLAKVRYYRKKKQGGQFNSKVKAGCVQVKKKAGEFNYNYSGPCFRLISSR